MQADAGAYAKKNMLFLNLSNNWQAEQFVVEFSGRSQVGRVNARFFYLPDVHVYTIWKLLTIDFEVSLIPLIRGRKLNSMHLKICYLDYPFFERLFFDLI